MNEILNKTEYTPVIGLEIHVQLKTKSKMFCSSPNNPDETEPNKNICEICTGQPGTLPVTNQEAVRLGALMGMALNCEIAEHSKFDRKSYFYPDLPKGYQISQYDKPIAERGFLDIKVGDKIKRIRIRRAHLEEDAGKNVHPEGLDYSLVDYNWAGTPLLEIVSEPDIHTAAEAKTYTRELYLAVKYAGVSDADLYYGNMRFDVNVSVSKTDQLGTRSETKNLN